MKKYFGIVLFRTENKSTNVNSYEETYLSIEASNIDEVRNNLIEYAKSCETKYTNDNNEIISVVFEKIIDVNEYLREQPQGNYHEIYSRHFDDIEAYSKFEKLYRE